MSVSLPYCRLWILNLFLFLYSHCSLPSISIAATSHQLKPDSLIDADSSLLTVGKRLVLVSTISGKLYAINPHTGHVKWSLTEDPVLRVPSAIQHGFTFLPDPQDGSLYVLGDGRLKKMPFTIPQLVQTAPCKSSDGLLYAGGKKDVWLGIDPNTGHKVETLSEKSADRVCPLSSEKAVFIGRTEYQISMFDELSRVKRWNATFSDYSAHVLPEDVTYPLRHFSSSSNGRIVTVDQTSGRILWDHDFDVPIVAIYLLQSDGLHRLPNTVVGRETLDSLIENSDIAQSRDWVNDILHGRKTSTKNTDSSSKSLYATLYVGETNDGLYALPSFVDEKTITISPKYLGPLLLEGPSDDWRKNHLSRPIVHIDGNTPTITHRTVDGEFLLLGYHDPPSLMPSRLFSLRSHQRQFETPSFPHISFVPSPGNDDRHFEPDSSSHDSVAWQQPSDSSFALVTILWTRYPFYLASLFLGVFVLLIVTVWMCGRQSGFSPFVGESRSVQTSKQAFRGFWPRIGQDSLQPGWLMVGKLHYDPQNVLGRGCEGTVVYKGRFEGREVAVKRVMSDFFKLADREVDLLRESDMHSNVIRYFCMEADSQFRYIALELCCATLQDYVEKRPFREKCPLNSVTILEQAARGLAHLHSLKIVHRDIKPHNVLLSYPNQKGQMRALISDFGLCKRLEYGRNSVSRRSGTTGTYGWIAPEALNSEASVTCAVDLFSLGCVFYYVLTIGAHPFGDNFRRQANIEQGNYSLKELSDSTQYIGVSLIESLLNVDPRLRPSADAVYSHPFFWSKERQLQFFSDVSDRVEREDDKGPVIRRLEKYSSTVVTNNWRQVICFTLAEDLRRFRSYKGHSVRDLLRAMRNKKHHYRELPAEVRRSLGSIPDQFVDYFTGRFPRLLLHTYEALNLCRLEEVFKNYYSNGEFEQFELFDSNDKWTRGVAVL